MKKLLAAVALLFAATLASAQTTIGPGGAIYDSTSGVFKGFVNRVTGAEETVGRRLTQASPPTCSTNCGTSPTVTGSDTAMLVTMGATGVPASAWVVTFNVTWAAAPACVAQMALASMANTKLPIALAITTTTVTVTTNGVAPANGDKYTILCAGVS